MELAQEEVRANTNPTRLMKKFANISLAHAEHGCHDLFSKHGYSVPIKIWTLDAGETLKQFPYLLFSDWAAYLLKTDRLARQLCGVRNMKQMKETLTEFWKRYRDLHGGHEIFTMEDSGEINLSLAVPVFSHTDEGRSYKHLPLWILSTHGCLGRGSKTYISRKKSSAPIHHRPMGMNFVGSTWATQFMTAAMLREKMNDNPGAMDAILKVYAQDMEKLAREGIFDDNGENIRFIHLGSKGNWANLDHIATFLEFRFLWM